MPAEPLFDLSPIDLSGVVADAQEIARYNPHRGDVILIDEVIWHDEECDHALARLRIREDSWWVQGHIPGMPLMPGVLMVEAGAQLASFMYYRRSGQLWFAGFTRIQDVTFRASVRPGDELLILSRCVKYALKRFVTDIQGIVDGQIVFDGRITGMAFAKMPVPDRRPLTEEEIARHSSGGSVVRG